MNGYTLFFHNKLKEIFNGDQQQVKSQSVQTRDS